MWLLQKLFLLQCSLNYPYEKFCKTIKSLEENPDKKIFRNDFEDHVNLDNRSSRIVYKSLSQKMSILNGIIIFLLLLTKQRNIN